MLIDLFSQSEAVCRYVDGWSISEIIGWIQEFGTIIAAWLERHVVGNYAIYAENQRYIFHSNCCFYLRTIFQFENAKLIIIKHGYYYS